MGKGPCDFKQRNVRAAIKAALQGGMKISRVEVEKDRIVIFGGESGSEKMARMESVDEVEQWLGKHNARRA